MIETVLVHCGDSPLWTLSRHQKEVAQEKQGLAKATLHLVRHGSLVLKSLALWPPGTCLQGQLVLASEGREQRFLETVTREDGWGAGIQGVDLEKTPEGLCMSSFLYSFIQNSFVGQPLRSLPRSHLGQGTRGAELSLTCLHLPWRSTQK